MMEGILVICRHCGQEIQRGWEFGGDYPSNNEFYLDDGNLTMCEPEKSNQVHEPKNHDIPDENDI